MAHDTLLEVLHDANLVSAAVRTHVLEAVKHVGEARALMAQDTEHDTERST